MARFGDGLAVGPDLEHAAESAVDQALTKLDDPPDLVCVFVCGEDTDAVAEAGQRAMAMAGAAGQGVTTLGCTASGVIGGNRGIEETSAISAWAATLPSVRRTPFRLDTIRSADRLVVTGMPERQDDDVVAVILTDPYTFPVDAFVERSTDALDGLPLVGGLANGLRGGDSVRLFLDGRVHKGGAVGVVLGGALDAATVVSQGCRPIGPAMVATKTTGNEVIELASSPAFAKLEQIISTLPEDEQELAAQGLHIGIAMDEYAERHERGDFLIRGVVGADRDTGTLTVGDIIDVGQTVRFQVRDAAAADADLDALLADFAALSGVDPVEGALLFSCNGRGTALFPSPDHDVLAVRRVLAPSGVGGFFAAGEIGPVGGRNHVHGFTASILAFGPGSGSDNGYDADGLRGDGIEREAAPLRDGTSEESP